MKLQQYLLNHYLHIPYEEFSHKAVSALGIMISIQHNTLSEMSSKQKESLVDAIARVKQIIETTRKDIQVSLYVLDRNIIPQDIAKNSTTFTINFPRIRNVNDQQYIKMSSDQIQQALCTATAEIHELLMMQMAGFSDQMFFEDL